MRDVVLLQVSDRRALDRVLQRTLEILDSVYRGDTPRRYETWTAPRSGVALVQATHPRAPETVPIHHTWREGFAYSGFVSTPRKSAREVRELLSTSKTGDLALRDSPGGIATFFYVDAWRRRCWAWSSHAHVGGLFATRGDGCIALSNRSTISHLCGLQRTTPRMSTRWAGRVLLGNNTLWDDTAFEGTSHPPPRNMFVLRGDDLGVAPHPIPLGETRYADRDPAGIAALNEAAIEALSVLRRWPRAELWLSGGKDSRYVAALAKAAGIDVDVVTHATPETGEGPAAAAVARAVGVPLRFKLDPGIATGDALLPTVLGNLRRCDGLLSENRQLPYLPVVADGVPMVHGQAHHPRGGYKTRPIKSRQVMQDSIFDRAIGDRDLVIPELGAERHRRLDELLSGYQVSHPVDLAYWMYNDWRMSRWTIGAYAAGSRSRPLVWPMMDERVLRVIARLSSFDRLSEVAFFAAMSALCPDLARVPIYKDQWMFDHGPIGKAEFPVGFEERNVPFEEKSGGAVSAEKRVATIRPLFRRAIEDMPHAAQLRSLVLPSVVEALCDAEDPAVTLGIPHIRVINFMWKLVAIALVLEGSWLSADLPVPAPD